MDQENTQLIIIVVSGEDERVTGLRVEDTDKLYFLPVFHLFKKWGSK